MPHSFWRAIGFNDVSSRERTNPFAVPARLHQPKGTRLWERRALLVRWAVRLHAMCVLLHSLCIACAWLVCVLGGGRAMRLLRRKSWRVGATVSKFGWGAGGAHVGRHEAILATHCFLCIRAKCFVTGGLHCSHCKMQSRSKNFCNVMRVCRA
jgi:hypothetical protein